MKNYQLPKEFAEKWLAALRSGKYKQTNGYLQRGKGTNKTNCCLGVAGIICNIPQYKLIKKETLRDFDDYKVPYQLIGTRGENELVKLLTDMNDKVLVAKKEYAHQFTEIADWIEANVELI